MQNRHLSQVPKICSFCQTLKHHKKKTNKVRALGFCTLNRVRGALFNSIQLAKLGAKDFFLQLSTFLCLCKLPEKQCIKIAKLYVVLLYPALLGHYKVSLGIILNNVPLKKQKMNYIFTYFVKSTENMQFLPDFV